MVFRYYVGIIKNDLCEWLHNAGKWNLSKTAGNSNTAPALYGGFKIKYVSFSPSFKI